MNVRSRTIWATSKRGSPSLRILACPTAFRTPSLSPDVSGGTPGLAGTTANLQLFLFDPKGRLAVGGFFVNGVAAPSNRTGFFIQLSAGSTPAGRFTWLMVIFDAFGNTLPTPFQALPRPIERGRDLRSPRSASRATANGPTVRDEAREGGRKGDGDQESKSRKLVIRQAPSLLPAESSERFFRVGTPCPVMFRS